MMMMMMMINKQIISLAALYSQLLLLQLKARWETLRVVQCQPESLTVWIWEVSFSDDMMKSSFHPESNDSPLSMSVLVNQ